jgi:hypothetical protein
LGWTQKLIWKISQLNQFLLLTQSQNRNGELFLGIEAAESRGSESTPFQVIFIPTENTKPK